LQILKTNMQIFASYLQNVNITFKEIGHGGEANFFFCSLLFGPYWVEKTKQIQTNNVLTIGKRKFTKMNMWGAGETYVQKSTTEPLSAKQNQHTSRRLFRRKRRLARSLDRRHTRPSPKQTFWKNARRSTISTTVARGTSLFATYSKPRRPIKCSNCANCGSDQHTRSHCPENVVKRSETASVTDQAFRADTTASAKSKNPFVKIVRVNGRHR